VKRLVKKKVECQIASYVGEVETKEFDDVTFVGKNVVMVGEWLDRKRRCLKYQG
jgi:hypothetical protein